MALNPNIILSGRQPNLVNAFAQGQQAGAQSNEIRDQNAMRAMLREQGPNIMAGEKNALNALSRFDPEAALGIQDKRMQIKQREDALRRVKESARLKATQAAASMSEQAREQERQTLDRALAAGTAAETPEQWDAAMRQFGAEDLVGQFEQREMAIAAALGLKEALERNAPPEPQSPEGKLQADIDAGIVEPGAGNDQSAAEQKIERLVSTGMPRNVAIGIVDGRLKVSRDPLKETVQIIDVATGQPWTGGDAPQGQPQEQPAQDQPQGGQELSFGEQFESAERAGGFGGVARGIANTVADTFGRELPYQRTANAQGDFANFGEGIVNAFASAYGRQPPSWLLQNIAALAPQPGLFEGSGKMQSKLRAMGRELQSRRSALSSELNRDMAPDARSDVEGQILGIDAAMQQINQALEGFDDNGASQGSRGRADRREDSGQSGSRRLRFNPETGQLEPVE